MNKTQQKIPKWFKGNIYLEGDTVANIFTKEEFKLNALELSIYDFIIGAGLFLEKNYNNKLAEEHSDALYWFRQNNVEAYMVLLD